MKRVVLMLALVLALPLLASAADYTYFTDGFFSFSGTQVYTNTHSSITFVPQTLNGPNVPDGTPAAMGAFNFQINAPLTPTPPADSYTGTFTLQIFQTNPAGSPFPATLVGNITGNLVLGSNGVIWYFGGAPIANIEGPVGTITSYALETPHNVPCTAAGHATNCISFGNPNLSSGGFKSTTIQADVTQVPEPASIMLFGTGLSGLAGMIRRRMKK